MEQEKLPNMSKRGEICQVLKGKERECESERGIQEIMAENSSNLAINIASYSKKLSKSQLG